jgi:hypothetical protein
MTSTCSQSLRCLSSDHKRSRRSVCCRGSRSEASSPTALACEPRRATDMPILVVSYCATYVGDMDSVYFSDDRLTTRPVCMQQVPVLQYRRN